MSEELEDKKEPKEPEAPTPAEAKARKNGWVPEDQWKGEAEDWVSYGEYNVRGEMLGRISEQSSIIAHLTNKVEERDLALKDIKALQSTIADREFKRAMSTLKKQKALAVDERDGEKVVEIDEEISELKAKQVEIQAAPDKKVPQADNVPAELTQWLNDPQNAWYSKNDFLKSVADGIAYNIKDKDPLVTPGELLRRMDKKLREEMPHHFKEPTPAVDDGGGDQTKRNDRAGGRSSRKYSDLDDNQKKACDRFVHLELMTRQEYIDELVAAGDL